MFESFWQDVRYALRTLRRAPGFTFVAVSSLAVSIGVGTLVFGLVAYALSGTPRPVKDIDRVVDLYTNVRDMPFQTSSYADYLDVKARSSTLQDVVASSPVLLALNPGSGTRMVIGEIVSGNYFDTLGLNVAFGRPLQPSDDRPDAPRVIVLSYGFWQRELGGKSNVVGQTVRIRGQIYTIVGVASELFAGMTVFPAEMWIPMTWIGDAEIMGITDFVPSPGTTPLERRGERWLWLKGRLKNGRTVEQTRVDLAGIMQQLEVEYPASNKGRRFSALPTRDVRIHPAADGFLAPAAVGLTLVIGLLLLVACANVMGMQLARATGRLREVVIRMAIGASRGRLIRQLLTESVLLSCLGGLAGVGLVWLLMRATRIPDVGLPIPVTFTPSIGTPALWFAILASMLAGVVSGLAPALQATRAGQRSTLRRDLPSVRISTRMWSLRDGLVIVQTAAAVVLLVTAALLTRSVLAALKIDLGFTPASVTAISTGTSVIGYDNARAERFYDAALAQLISLPEIERVAYTWRAPLDLTFSQDPIVLPDRFRPGDSVIPVERTFVSPEYFSTLGVRLVEGRDFSTRDTRESPRVAIVNETMARRFWKSNRDALGQRFRLRTLDGPEFEIVGVSADYKVRSVGEPPTSYIHYAASQQRTNGGQILVKTRAGSTPPLDRIRRVLEQLEPDILFQASSMDSKVATVLLPARAAAFGLSTVGLIAMLFAAVGLYGVTAFMVAQRTHEFGVRLALGARPRAIIGLVLRRGFALAGVGALFGGLVAAVIASGLSNVLYGVTAADPMAWFAGIVVVLGVSLLAHAVPARRAAGVNPTQALRAE